MQRFLLIISILYSHSLLGQFQGVEKADSLFDNQEYTRAFIVYDSLFQNGVTSEEILLKMSMINEGLGKIPQAIFFLSLYQNKTGDDLVERKILDMARDQNLEGYTVSDFELIQNAFEEWLEELLILVIVLLSAYSARAVFIILKRKKKEVSHLMVSSLLALAVIFLAAYEKKKKKEGIFIAEKGYLVEGPSAGSEILFEVNPGDKLEILGTQDSWTKVIYKEQEGFIRNSQVWPLF